MIDKNPFVEPVEEIDQYCWRDTGRPCSSECVAYDEKSQVNGLWSPCILLNLKRAQAKSYANIAAELKRYNDRKDAYDKELRSVLAHTAKKTESQAYAEKVKEMDRPPPEIKV